MNVVSGITVYVLVWWVVLFCVLPVGIQNIQKSEDGSMPGAPVAHNMKKKVVITTLVSCVVWVVIYLLIKADIVSFHDIAQRMEM